jgi:aspartate racemase
MVAVVARRGGSEPAATIGGDDLEWIGRNGADLAEGAWMKTIGLLGGMSWESTVPYYRIINQMVGRRLGGLHSAKIVLYSVDFEEIEQLQHRDGWHDAGELLADAAAAVESAGADFLVICTNTMHKVAPEIEKRIGIPLLHIADPTAAALEVAEICNVGLLGTSFTMEQSFYRDRLASHELVVQVPCAPSRRLVHDVIYQELCHGVISEASRQSFVEVVEELANLGCQAVILGCTEIGLLLRPQDVEVPLLDTTRLHAEAAAEMALQV